MANKYPSRWTKKHGAFYYVVPPNLKDKFGGKSWYRLGKTEPEAYQEWARLLGDSAQNTISTMSKLFDRYMVEISSAKAPSTHRTEQVHIKKLRAFFGQMKPSNIKPVHVHQYLDLRVNKRVAANREVSLLSHVFTKAIRWGVIEINPCIGKKVEKYTERPRDRYVTDDEYFIFYDNFAGMFLQVYLDVKYLIGQRKADVLRIKMSDITDDGIHIKIGKTRKSILITWSEELRQAVENVKTLKRKIGSIYLFATRSGQCYVKRDGTTSGFDSVWQRRMKLFVDAGNERFNEHDIRAKTASDTNVEHATDLLMHRSKEFTERVYRRKQKVVSPLVRKSKKGEIC